MHFFDNKEHKAPHIHARYQDEEVVISIPDGVILSGKLTPAKLKLLQSHICKRSSAKIQDFKTVTAVMPYRLPEHQIIGTQVVEALIRRSELI